MIPLHHQASHVACMESGAPFLFSLWRKNSLFWQVMGGGQGGLNSNKKGLVVGEELIVAFSKSEAAGHV
jgi:hypothetical protein